MPTPLATPATTESSTLYFGPWYRRSPFFEKTLEAGCSAYDIYNHMYLPGYYADPVEEYWALLNGVTLWDVSVERIVEITGPDASAFVNTLTCRDLTTCEVGQGKYVLITAEDGGIVNDPVLLRVEADRWWLALADSDAGLWARGVAVHSGLDVTVREPEVYPVQVQGPKSKDTMVSLFGDQVLDIKYYWTLTTDLDGIPVVISPDRLDRRDRLRDLPARPVARSASCGTGSWPPASRTTSARSRRARPDGSRPASSTTARTSPSGTRRSTSWAWSASSRSRRPTTSARPPSSGSAARASTASSSASRWTATRCRSSSPRTCTAFHDGEAVGTVTDFIWSPRLEKNIGYVWVPIGLAGPGNALEVEAPDGARWAARTAAIPFLDPKKQVPLA